MPSVDGKSYVPIVEILNATIGVKNLIRENKVHQIDSLIETGSKFGMITFDDALRKAIAAGKIKREDALLYARMPSKL